MQLNRIKTIHNFSIKSQSAFLYIKNMALFLFILIHGIFYKCKSDKDNGFVLLIDSENGSSKLLDLRQK